MTPRDTFEPTIGTAIVILALVALLFIPEMIGLAIRRLTGAW
jgi:hypothetical protein